MDVHLNKVIFKRKIQRKKDNANDNISKMSCSKQGGKGCIRDTLEAA